MAAGARGGGVVEAVPSKTGLGPLSVLDPTGASCSKGIEPNGFTWSRASMSAKKHERDIGYIC